MERDKSIDILKGIGILFVIMGHIQNYIPKNLLIYIYSFHMPLFFYISGFLYKDKYKELSIKEYCKKRSKQLIYPYFTLFIINFVWLVIKNHSISNIIKYILSFIYSNYIFDSNYVGTIWFLLCLFNVECLYFIIDKKNIKKYKKIIFGIILIVGIMISQIVKIKYWRLPFWIDIALFGIIFYYIGTITSKYKEKLQLNNIKKLVFLVVCIIVNIIFIILNFKYCNNDKFYGRTDMLYLYFGNYLYYFIAAMSGIYTWHLISSIIKSNNILEVYGKNTLLIMGIHIIIYQILEFAYKYSGLSLNTNIVFMIMFISVAIVALICSFIIKKLCQ